MGVFKMCPITKKMHNTPGKRCRLCGAKRMRDFLKTKSGKRYGKKRNKTQAGTNEKIAYGKISWAIRQKEIPKPSVFRCFDCKRPAQVYDHRDYLKPYEIEPVCKVCNHKRGPGKNGSRKRSVK